jgi:hypothetical protein
MRWRRGLAAAAGRNGDDQNSACGSGNDPHFRFSSQGESDDAQQ